MMDFSGTKKQGLGFKFLAYTGEKKGVLSNKL